MAKWWRKRRDGEPEAIDNILARAGEDRYAPKRPPLSSLVWRTAVGPRIADQAQPLTLENGILLVRTTSSTWANELSMLSEMICSRLKAHGVAVDRLRFRTGRLDLPQRPIERRETKIVPVPIALPPPLQQRVDAIGDEELREAVTRAASQSLAFDRAYNVTSNESRRDAPAPRSVGRESAPLGQTGRADREAAPRSRAGDRDRSR